MDGRAGFAVGGFIAGAAAVAVACAVTLSNSAALADAPGAVVDVDVVRVSPSPSTTATAAPMPTATPKVVPVIPAPAPTTEVVPAPEAQDVAPHATTPSKSTPSSSTAPSKSSDHGKPSTPTKPSTPAKPSNAAKPSIPAKPTTPAVTPGKSQKDVAEEAVASGSWSKLKEWAESRGWSQEKIDRWIDTLQERFQHKNGSDTTANRTQAPAEKAGHPSKSDESSSHGWKRDQSPQPPRGD